MLGRAELISVEGNVVRRWQYQDGDRWVRAELLPNGDLLVVGMEHHGSGGGRPVPNGITDSSRYVMRLDWDSKLVWKRKLLAHHDIELTPDGRLLVLTFKRRMEPSIHATIPTRDDYMTLLDQDGRVLESRSMLESIRNSPEHFSLDTSGLTPSKLGVHPWIDLFHSNSVEWMHHKNLFSKHPIYGPNNVLVCFRHQDRVAVFNYQEKKVVWSWGANQLSGPHDAQVLKDGHILLFDNGLSRGWSRAVELDPLTNHIVWEYKANPPKSFYTASKGSVQRLPNGNTLLAESDKGRAIEIAPDGSVVWEFICPYGVGEFKRSAIVRIIHHSAEFVDKMVTASQ
ncbi:aryl-sulfate sulfotransferase [bacterium]|nr:aryl-sulfate sulfotransferase [bacterium]